MSTVNSTPEPATLDLEPVAPEVKRYQRQKLLASLASLAITLAFLTAMALGGGPRIDAFLRDWVGDGRWVRLIALAFFYAAALELLTLPLDFWSGFTLEHRYQLSTLSLRGWIWRRIKGWLVGGPIGLVLVLGLYALVWFTGGWWWVLAAVGWLGVSLILGQLLPVVILPLFYKVTRLEETSLLERLRRLAEGTGVNVEGVYRLELSAETRKANAALAGLGPTRRVLLGDTLLEQFSPEEIEVVFAHELGHHVHRHLLKMVVVSVILSAGGFWLADLVLRHSAERLHYASYADPAAFPLLLLVLALFGLILAPAQNALSRYFERQCDGYALARTGLRRAYRSAFIKLARLNKADTDPNPLVVWLFDDHPPIRQRLALADVVALPDSTGAR